MIRVPLLLCLCLCLAVQADSTSASVLVGDQLRMGDGPGSPGGIFQVDLLRTGPGADFQTFCVELEQYINFGTVFVVESITTQNSSGRSLTPFAAWLYNSFLDGQLQGFNSSSAADANTLQFAIWKSLGYTAAHMGNSWYQTYQNRLNTKSWATDYAASGWTGLGNIRIMNLRMTNAQNQLTGYAQDQLVRTVPEPAAIAVWLGLAVSSAIICRRTF